MASVKWLPITTASLGLIFFIASSFSEKAPYLSFARDATSATETEYYDYIIVGGGTAGCAVAVTLSSTPKVLLLERGGLPYKNPNITHMMGLITTLSDTSPNSAAQQFVSTDGISNIRGRVLGGGSAINDGFYSRASMEYVEEVAWEPRLVNESYEWVEKKVVFRSALLGWEVAVRDGLVEAGLMPDNGFTYEHIQGTKIGEQKSIQSFAGKKPKAYGVVFKDSKGNNHTAHLNKKSTSEIIVSAGTLGSPQLLMLSGIGLAQHLKAHGIYVILDQPMVGQGMSDNPMNAAIVPSPRPVETSFVKVVGITDDVGCYIEEICGLFGLGFISPNNQSLIQSITIVEKEARPFSTGYLELQSNDPEENPRVTFNYFQDPRDLQRIESLLEYRYPSTTFESLMKLVFELSKNRRRKHRITGVDSWEQFCIDTMITVYHYHGGCQVGRVVDQDYRVMGVESLRVIDGSTFINSPGTNPQATLMMLGRYMGQKILQQ
ncbi:hypothetical protein ACS0TY_000234 [Phlomoides rotata]